jgi:hypothetical protein
MGSREATVLASTAVRVSPSSMPDICDLILDDHELFRRRFAELDDELHSEPRVVAALWQPLAEHLERHASAEEEVFYPQLLERVDDGEHETHHAVRDHNKIRDALRKVAATEPGSDAWWEAVGAANEENSDHMAEEERGPLSAFRRHAGQEIRKELGARFVAFNAEHAGGRELDTDDVDPDEYIEDHTSAQARAASSSTPRVRGDEESEVDMKRAQAGE